MRSGKQSGGRGCLFWFGIVLLPVFLAFGYISYDSPKARVHYRIRLTLEVDGQPVSGSVVQEFVISVAAIKVPRSSNVGYGAYGEAMAIALPNGDSLFVAMELPRKDGTWSKQDRFRYRNFFRNIVNVPRESGDSSSDYVRKYRALSGSYDVPFELMPLMVKFTRERDPNSAIRVIPRMPEAGVQTLEDNEVVVLNATLTITEMPVSKQISDGHAWLLESWKRPSDVSKGAFNDFARSIGKLSFKPYKRD